MKDKITVALIQNSYEENVKNNIEKNLIKIKEASKIGADFVSLSELHNSLYFCQREDTEFFKLAEEIPGNSTEIYGKLSKELNITLLISIFEKRARGIFHNTALILDRGEIAGIYRKMHIPDDPGFYEKFYFTPGDLGFEPIDTSIGRVGVLICWDQWFPEAARIVTLKGAQIIFYPTAIGFFEQMKNTEPFSAQRWEDAMRSHASLNGVFVAAVNRVGKEGDIEFWGGSFVADPFGQMVVKANSTDEEIVFATLDLDKIFESQDGWGFLRNRRTDSYSMLLEKKIK